MWWGYMFWVFWVDLMFSIRIRLCFFDEKWWFYRINLIDRCRFLTISFGLFVGILLWGGLLLGGDNISFRLVVWGGLFLLMGDYWLRIGFFSEVVCFIWLAYFWGTVSAAGWNVVFDKSACAVWVGLAGGWLVERSLSFTGRKVCRKTYLYFSKHYTKRVVSFLRRVCL